MRQFLSKDKRLRKPPEKKKKTATQNSHQKITTTCSHNNRSLPHLGAILSQDQCYKKAGTEKETENRWRSKHQARYRLPRVQKRERLSPPTPTSPRIQHIVHKIDRRKACSHKYYTPSLAAQWKESGKRHRAKRRRGFARRKRRREKEKAQTTIAAPVFLSLGLFCRPYREAKPRGQKPTGQNVNYHVQTTEWKTTTDSPMKKTHVS